MSGEWIMKGQQVLSSHGALVKFVVDEKLTVLRIIMNLSDLEDERSWFISLSF